MRSKQLLQEAARQKLLTAQRVVRVIEGKFGNALLRHPDCPIGRILQAIDRQDVLAIKQLAKEICREDLNLWTVDELRSLAKNYAIPNYSALPKDYLIQEIERCRNEKSVKNSAASDSTQRNHQ